jgi:pheromone shutdown protein TraB
VVIALSEIIERDDLGKGAGIGWMFAILVIPFLGVIAYYIFGKSQIPAAYRWVLLAGGIAVYALFLVIGLIAGGVV